MINNLTIINRITRKSVEPSPDDFAALGKLFAPKNGVTINDTFVPFADLQADVNAAINKGFSNQFAFTPETVQALLNYIEENKAK